MKPPASPARTWKGNDYQAVWWDEATRLDEAKQLQDRARKVEAALSSKVTQLNILDDGYHGWTVAELRDLIEKIGAGEFQAWCEATRQLTPFWSKRFFTT
jgi:hypothetical protein